MLSATIRDQLAITTNTHTHTCRRLDRFDQFDQFILDHRRSSEIPEERVSRKLSFLQLVHFEFAVCDAQKGGSTRNLNSCTNEQTSSHMLECEYAGTDVARYNFKVAR